MKKYKKIYIEITNNCNLKCSFCSEVKRKRRFMTTEEFENILIKIKDYTDYIYLHIKGEPLLHPNIIEFLHLALYSWITIVSNEPRLLEPYLH